MLAKHHKLGYLAVTHNAFDIGYAAQIISIGGTRANRTIDDILMHVGVTALAVLSFQDDKQVPTSQYTKQLHIT